MKVVEIAFTVVPVTNLKQSREFYERVVGLTPTHVFEKGGMGMVEYDIGTATFSIGCGAPLFKPSKEGGAVAFEVENFDAAIATLRKANTHFAMEPSETPVCRMAVVTDPDGNFLMVHKRKGR